MTSSKLPSVGARYVMRRSSIQPRLLAIASIAALMASSGCGGSSSTTTKKTATTSPPAGSTSSSTAATQTAVTSTASAGADTVSASSGAITATLHASTHQPKVEAPWPIAFVVTRAGRAASASVSYEYLFGGQVVARRSHYTFVGHFSDVFKWPATAVGYPLTFRAVIASQGVTIDLDYPVQVSG